MKPTTFAVCLVGAMSFMTAGSVVPISGGAVPVSPVRTPVRTLNTPAPAGGAVTARRLLLPEVCFAPGTSAEQVRRYAAARGPAGMRTGFQSDSFQYTSGANWWETATDGFVDHRPDGSPVTLTWSIVPDGTPSGAFGGIPGESGNPSNLRAFLNGIYPGGEAEWMPIIQSVFDRWGQITGVTYVQVGDDGAPMLGGNAPNGVFPYAPGVLGVRGDVRITGHSLDGPSGVLAYNFFPDFGDMFIDTADTFYNDKSNFSRRLVNVLAHEHGHGVGLRHSCPIQNTKLMEPFASTAFLHAQLDDILGGQRANGDNSEDNETSGAAANLGAIGNGTTNLIERSIDDDSDVDFYKFTVPAGKKAAVTLTPIGSTYLAGPQNTNGSCSAGTNFNALTVQNLGVELINTNGSSVMVSATSAGAGAPENIATTPLLGGGTFFVRVFPTAAANNVQAYQLAITISDDPPTMSINDVFITEGNVGGSVLSFTVSLSAPAPAALSANFATADGTATIADNDYLGFAGVVSFSPGQSSQQLVFPVNGDVKNEPDETFVVNLSNISGAIMGDAQGIATITNDDPLPTLSVNDATVNEGNAGTVIANFTVTLSAVSGQTVTVTALTTGGTAGPPADYTDVNTVLTFTPGETTKSVPVTVTGETVVEPDETFNVVLTTVTNATILDGTGVGTILSEEMPSRSFVSASGSDLNDCSVQSVPCRHIARAMTQTAPDGEVIVLTPGEYENAPLTLTQGIKISSPSGTVAFVRQPITINAPGGRVVLRGLTLKGTGAGNGILVNAAGSVSIEDSTIDRWLNGLRLNNPAAAQISILNTMVRNNNSGVLDTGASALNRVTISESRFEGNGKGLSILTGTFQVKDSMFSGNATSGISVGPGVVDITRSEFSLNGKGLETLAGGTARIGRSLVFGNTIGLSAAGGSTLSSFGTNVIRGNGSNTVGTISAVVEQ